VLRRCHNGRNNVINQNRICRYPPHLLSSVIAGPFPPSMCSLKRIPALPAGDASAPSEGAGTQFSDQYARPREGRTHPAETPAAPELTVEERRNGWTPAALAAYRLERDRAADLIGGNIVTEFTGRKLAPRIENATALTAGRRAAGSCGGRKAIKAKA